MRIKILLIICLCSLFTICQAQRLELTREGMRSSVDSSSVYVEYFYAHNSKKSVIEYFDKKVAGVDFFSYETRKIGEDKAIVSGYIDGTILIIFGRSEIAFELQFSFDESSVKVSCGLATTSGKPLKLGRLFGKKSGKARISGPKTLIETKVNDIIRSVFDEEVIIK